MVEAAASLTLMPDKPTDRVEESQLADYDWETRASMRAMRKADADVIPENLAWGLPVIQRREGIGGRCPPSSSSRWPA